MSTTAPFGGDETTMGQSSASSSSRAYPQLLPDELDPHDLVSLLRRLVIGFPMQKLSQSNPSSAARTMKQVELDRDQKQLSYSPSKKNTNSRFSIEIRDIIGIRLFSDLLLVTDSGDGDDDTSRMAGAGDDGDDDDGKTEGKGHRSKQEAMTMKGIEIRTSRDVTLRLVASTSAMASIISQALTYLVISKCPERAPSEESNQVALIIPCWIEIDVDQKKYITFNELKQAVTWLGIEITPESLMVQFQLADNDGNGKMEFSEFAKLCRALATRPQLEPLFSYFAGGRDSHVLNVLQLQDFFLRAQADRLSPKALRRVMVSVTKAPEQRVWTFRNFCSFLMSPAHNGWVKPSHLGIYQDMTQRLPHYYIAASRSSHLLVGTSQSPDARSSLEMFRFALRSGCRYLDLEIFPEDKFLEKEKLVVGDPARQLNLPLEKVLDAIRECAFEKSEFPLFLALELHHPMADKNPDARFQKYSDVSLADELKNRLHEKLGSLLFTAANWHQRAMENPNWFMSPFDLRRKICIIYKIRPDEFDFAKHRNRGIVVCQSDLLCQKTLIECRSVDYTKPDQIWAYDVLLETFEARRVVSRTGDGLSSDTEIPVQVRPGTVIHRQTREVIKDLTSRMLVRQIPDRVPAAASATAAAATGGGGAGTDDAPGAGGPARAGEGNDPFLPAWLLGIQLVPMSYQNWDGPLQSMEARFQLNGGCGYLLKPEHLRIRDSVMHNDLYDVQVRVVMGFQLPNMALRPDATIEAFVRLRMEGVEAYPTFRTKCASGNSFDPVWDESFTFVVSGIEFAALTVTLMAEDINDVEVASSTCPLLSLRQGYRAVPLRSFLHGELLTSSAILCHFAVSRHGESYLEEVLMDSME